MAKDNDSDIDGAEDRELVRFLEETAFALKKGDRSGRVVSDDISKVGIGTKYLLRSSRIGLIYTASNISIRRK